MKEEQQLKLQAYLDGELPKGQAREVAALIQRDPAAAALLAELRDAREALTQAAPAPVLPESREFYWSKIECEIGKGDLAPPRRDAPIFHWRYVFWPVGAAALCSLFLTIETARLDRSERELTAELEAPVVEPAQPDAEAVVYQDKADSTTLVWFAKPENDTAPASPTKP